MKALLLRLLCLFTLPAFSQQLPPGVVGDYHPATSPEAKYAVLVLGGAEGGKPTELARLFVEQGYPVLSLAYCKAAGLPAELEQIPLEYFDAPMKWLARQAPGKRQGILLVGWSKGAELALLLASRHAAVRGVVAISPSSVAWAGILKDWKKTPGSSWTAHRQPLPFVPFRSEGATSLLTLYANSLTNQPAAAAAGIPLERSKAAVLLLSGSQDEVWPATLMCEQLMARLQAARYARPYSHLNYPELGHLLNEKFLPATPEHPSRTAILAFLRAVE
ncbi:acyl-CoA thioester hydrolase/BAAT C-terminal domain-containing protein [Hymenobacter chitinivorans]|uniref:Bile acid acyltransferase/acyl-CoA thioester hydrolase-like protein n=1 Tax=Hymenobacter chitinivorans DSM 11115 TaxID=1121954 RepID=A0A2M9BQQ1_9BACT|nr:acyl-CoA thioester hydrolase/BAAT C-terminal domain-containing protein [Hymenobacter chitinivorans]PJJ60290.1 bile acid acyltransferase/acyl-CoA thioester hydrolase-like protein [Hymenobacter chitinivorans DSM 11115]